MIAGPLDDMVELGHTISRNNPPDKIIKVLQDSAERVKTHVEGLGGEFGSTHRFILAWGVVFNQTGRPTLRLPPKTIAALAFTDPAECEFKAPWPTFLIRIDASVFGEPVDIAVLITETGVSMCTTLGEELAYMNGDNWVELAKTDARNFELNDRDDGYAPLPIELVKRRTATCARIAAGASQLVMNAPPQKARLTPGQLLANRLAVKKGKPVLTEYVVGQDVTIDLREHVREYTSGVARTMKSIRWIVRGHWRNQVAGKGRAERRRTWIKPYMKGDKEAATLVRGYSVKGENDESAGTNPRN